MANIPKSHSKRSSINGVVRAPDNPQVKAFLEELAEIIAEQVEEALRRRQVRPNRPPARRKSMR